MKTRTILLIAVGIGLIAFGLWRYTKAERETQGEGLPADSTNTRLPLRIGFIAIADCAQLYVAEDRGFFKDHGLDVELTPIAGGTKIIEALGGGSLDVGFSNVVSVFLAREKGLDFALVYGGSMEDSTHAFSAILASSMSKVSTLKDLKGATVAVNTRHNVVELALGERLTEVGLSLEDVKLLEIPFPNMENVLLSGEVAAIAVVEPFVSYALSSGHAKRIGPLFTLPGDAARPIAGYCGSVEWFSTHTEEAKRFRQAMDDASLFIEDNQAATMVIIAKYTGLTEEQVAKVTLPRYARRFETGSLDALGNKLEALGWLGKKVKASDIVWTP